VPEAVQAAKVVARLLLGAMAEPGLLAKVARAERPEPGGPQEGTAAVGPVLGAPPGVMLVDTQVAVERVERRAAAALVA
jgi:alpha-D-ribose 1-methylphosphonate 5-triphosphate synthase subunit PhnH